MINTAVIIAGGEGSRLKPLSDNKPKAMVEIHGKPMLHWTLNWLKSQGITKVVIGVAYKKEKIYEFIEATKGLGLDVRFSEHTLEGGTAQGFKLAIQRHVQEETFLAMNCDEITNLSVANLYATHQKHHPLVTMAVAPFHCRFSIVNVEKEGAISGFKYGHILDDVLVSIGIYIFNRGIYDYIPETGSIENSVFTRLAKENRAASYRLAGKEQWISVNDIKNVKEVEENLHILTQ